MNVPGTYDAPAYHKLQRLALFAQIAWGDETPIRYGFRMTKTGVRIYVRQRRRQGNAIEQEGSSADQVVESMERFFLVMGAQATGKSEEFIKGLVDEATKGV